ncbi:hypothetical protein [Streptomyces olivaceoviridis]|uniref:hypothetical protein n=1 Tax=Streptomyces olivaceoviridis TaxID=1921 RepID=UPI0036F5E921
MAEADGAGRGGLDDRGDGEGVAPAQGDREVGEGHEGVGARGEFRPSLRPGLASSSGHPGARDSCATRTATTAMATAINVSTTSGRGVLGRIAAG